MEFRERHENVMTSLSVGKMPVTSHKSVVFNLTFQWDELKSVFINAGAHVLNDY